MFRLRCIPHASKIREKRASRASVDPGVVNVWTGIPAPIHPFPRNFQPHTDSQEFSRHMSSNNFPLSLSVFFETPREHRRPTRPHFIFPFDHFSPSFNSDSNQQQFRLFEQRHEYYSADYARLFRLKNPLRDFRRAAGSLSADRISFLFFFYLHFYYFFGNIYICTYNISIIYVYKYITIHGKRHFQTFQRYSCSPAFPFGGAFFSSFLGRTTRSKFSYVAIAREKLGNAKRYVSRKYTECRSITICENIVL